VSNSATDEPNMWFRPTPSINGAQAGDIAPRLAQCVTQVSVWSITPPARRALVDEYEQLLGDARPARRRSTFLEVEPRVRAPAGEIAALMPEHGWRACPPPQLSR
jgi:hypothetical protein